jgi:hypothetical protein
MPSDGSPELSPSLFGQPATVTIPIKLLNTGMPNENLPGIAQLADNLFPLLPQ